MCAQGSGDRGPSYDGAAQTYKPVLAFVGRTLAKMGGGGGGVRPNPLTPPTYVPDTHLGPWMPITDEFFSNDWLSSGAEK